jgi:signal transduction histidine kinase/CheY-like chemotaxis protein
MELEQVLRSPRFFAAFRRRRGGALFASGRPWHTGIAVRLRQARVGSLLAFARDGALVASGLLRRFWRTRVVERTLWLRTLELAWHASGAATQLADAALAGETIAQLATRIANIARELSNAEAVAVFGRSPKGPVVLGSAGGVPAADLAARTLLSGGPERRSEGVARAMSLPLRIRGNVVGALVLRFGPDRMVALKPLEPLLVRAGAVLFAAEREARKDRFLSLAAHELKTPLTSIKGFAYSLSRRMEKGEPADAKAVEILERQAERLHGLLEEMLEVSRLEMQRFVLHQEFCDLGELVESALRSVHRLGTETEVRVEGTGPLPLSADRERIERAIVALVLRACAFGAPLTLHATRDGLRARLRVTWAGARLTTHEREQAFDARWEEPQSARQGLGMALFIARSAVSLHGGELRADPDALVLELPLLPEATRKGEVATGRVLIVDDDESIARMLAEYLTDHGVQADWAGGGRQALEKIEGGQAPDLMVLDLRMPDLDGRELLALVRRRGLDPRVVLLSADRAVAEAARELRADGFVEKPFEPENLLAAVRRAQAARESK